MAEVGKLHGLLQYAAGQFIYLPSSREHRQSHYIDGQSQLSHVCAACCPIPSQTLGCGSVMYLSSEFQNLESTIAPASEVVQSHALVF